MKEEKREGSNLRAALSYRSKGLSVIPVGQDKKPLFAWKEFTERRASKSEIEKWWEENPRAGVAIVTGKISNLTVIDVESGGVTDYLPETLTIKTGGGGYHFYYKYNSKFKNSVRIKELTDIRNDGGYVVAPPSRHRSKKRYKIVKRSKIADFPSHLFITEKIKSAKNDWEELLSGVSSGSRNESATKVCGLFLTKTPYSLWEHIAWPALKNWNQFNDPPLPEKELRAVFESISSRVQYKQDDTEKEVIGLEELTEKYEKKIEEIKKGNILAIPTGFKILDHYLNGGWKSGELILIGARPSVGKTSLALTFANNAAEQGYNVLFFSIEMSSLDIYERLLSFITKIPCSEIIQGEVSKEKLERGYEKIRKRNILVAELANATSSNVIEIVKQVLIEQKIDLIVVDYLQFLNDKSKSGNESVRVGRISKNLKMLARMTGLPVICPAQLNRKAEEGKGREPKLSDLRESGNLEQDADVVILIDRNVEGDERNKATLILAKNRKGQTGRISTEFDLITTTFTETNGANL